MSTRRLVLITAVALVAAAGAAFGVTLTKRSTQPAPDLPAQPAPPPDSATQQQDPLMDQRTKGAPDAPLTVFEVSDFQCPYCRRFWAETLPIIDREYIQTGKVRFVFINLPLPQIHPNAAAAHELAMCAAQQDRFWPMHDELYDKQEEWSRLEEPKEYFLELAGNAGLDADSLNECIETGTMRWLIEAEAQTIASRGVTSTPSFIIEGGLMRGAAPIEDWRPILDSLFAARTQNP